MVIPSTDFSWADVEVAVETAAWGKEHRPATRRQQHRDKATTDSSAFPLSSILLSATAACDLGNGDKQALVREMVPS